MDAKERLTEIKDETLPETVQAELEPASEREHITPEMLGAVAAHASFRACDTGLESSKIKEQLSEQLNTAYKAYSNIAAIMREGVETVISPATISQETVANEFAIWLTDEKISFVMAAMEATPDLDFTLVATPNVLVSAGEIIRIAQVFGEDQPKTTLTCDALYNKYTAEQLSGTNPENGAHVVFSLVPDAVNPELSGSVVEQRAKLARLQMNNPYLKVSSVLEDMTYWQTLRARSRKPVSKKMYHITYNRHFDLPEQRLGRQQLVLFSYVYNDGRPFLSYSGVGDVRDGRVVVG